MLVSLARKIAIGVIGGLVLLIGALLLIAPGPGWLTIFIGLVILATEFTFARRLLSRVRQIANYSAKKLGLSNAYRQWLGLEKRHPHQPTEKVKHEP